MITTLYSLPDKSAFSPLSPFSSVAMSPRQHTHSSAQPRDTVVTEGKRIETEGKESV